MKEFTLQKQYDLVVDKLINWSELLVSMLPNMLLCLVILIAFYYLSKLTRKLVEIGSKKMVNNLALVKLLGTISFIIMLSIGIFIALSVLKLDKAVTSLLAGAGVVGLALGFAFQDSATNFISGVFIAVRKPFKIDDLIETAGEFGMVQQINLRNIIVKTFDGQELILPNKDVFQNKIKNYTYYKNRRVRIDCGVTYDADLEKVKKVGEEAISALEFVSRDKKVDVLFNEFGNSSINFTLYFWINICEEPGFLKAKNDAIIALKKTFDKNDISIPFPIRTLDINPKQFQNVITLKQS